MLASYPNPSSISHSNAQRRLDNCVSQRLELRDMNLIYPQNVYRLPADDARRVAMTTPTFFPYCSAAPLPEAPPARPETEPRPAPEAPPQQRPDLDPFNPPWPAGRPEPQPKA